ncbi:CLUMA_CG009866, isoform A [Clunio marinus]|uniref:Probable Ufm1-specific protease 2 n=1 Tax=Clunio marinus TaxID=568069 RepID=A0A1J1IA36_9DIPT|nr:CLUMA_CG009866, isoform A [Clunio marinus]
MTPKLQISQLVINRLKLLENVCGGGLFGLMYSKNLIILGFDLESSDKLNFKKMQDNFPTEIDLCGLFKFDDCTDVKAHMQEILINVDITDNPILIKCQRKDDGELELNASQWKNGKLEEIVYEVLSEEEIYKQFVMARLLGYIEIAAEPNEKSIKQEFMTTRKKLAYGNVLFQLQSKNVFFNNNEIVGAPVSLVSDIFDLVKKKVENVDKKKNKKETALTDFQMVNIDCLVKKSDEFEKNQQAALNLILEKNKVLIPITIDAIAAVHITTKALGLYDILIESLCRTLRLIEENLLDQLVECDELAVPLTYHFKPDNFGHYYTCIYPQSIPDEDEHLTAFRRELHQQFSLSMVRPVFRRANAFPFDVITSSLLVNPHVGLKNTVEGGKQSLVQGKYSYHHYMQDKFNDDGWGCAYRSLQTLCSWFRFQGYSEHPIPSHEDIQKYLVKVGDKPKTFVNSRQWIGSTEVSMCLNGFMNVDSRIMHVSSGTELASKGSELAYHFESQGTPIMIGGGVLAHTIIGVDFNSNTGELKFLILDPHFTGDDDLQVVQNKGWCGWKGVNFWNKTAYYNLCMPQRPAIF